MIGRKLAPVRNGEIAEQEHAHPFVPDVEKIKHATYKNFRKYEHLALVSIVTFSIRSSNFLKSTYRELKSKVKGMRKKSEGETAEPKEENKFLGIISDYKHRIRHIKHTITEEEEQK